MANTTHTNHNGVYHQRAAGREIMYRQMAYYRYRRYKMNKITTSRVTSFLTKVVSNNFALTASWQIPAATHLIWNVATNLRLHARWEMADIIYEYSNKKKKTAEFLWHKYFPPHMRAFCWPDALWDIEREIQNCRIKYTRGESDFRRFLTHFSDSPKLFAEQLGGHSTVPYC
jgi:hypothetical protein